MSQLHCGFTLCFLERHIPRRCTTCERRFQYIKCPNVQIFAVTHLVQRRRQPDNWCTSTVQALNYCSRFFFKSFSYLYEVVRTNVSTDFWTFRNFSPQFRQNCATIQQRICELSSAAERQIPSERTLQTSSKSAYKRLRNACSNYGTPQQHTDPDSEGNQLKTTRKQKHRPMKDNASRQDLVTVHREGC